jgi:lipopolysaccharide/colanic/teichoic acid biosynthesis glycosyltransferase
LLDNKENPETTYRASQVKIDDIFVNSTKIETLLDRILILKESKSFKVVESETASSISKSYNTPFFKRIFDILLASILLLLISPILFLFIIAIRLETRGKAFSFSKRVGSGYKVFDYYKLRTMFANADKRLKEQAYLAQHHKDVINSDAVNLIHDQTFSGTDHINKKEVQDTFIKFENDARLTKVGQIIRKLGIDKLPILFNVIKGDMSIVGNRPLTMSEAELLTCSDWIDRLHGPAGITGLWYLKQVEKSAKKNPVERKSLDNKYFEIAKSRFSFFKDIWIIMKTIPAIFQ